MRYQSLIVGICLLVGAFLFGRMIDPSGAGPSTEVDATQSEGTALAEREARPSVAQLPSTAGPRQSLKDRLRGKGTTPSRSSPSPFHLPSGNQSLMRDRDRATTDGAGGFDSDDSGSPVAVPDFSPLASQLTTPPLLGQRDRGPAIQPDEVVDSLPSDFQLPSPDARGDVAGSGVIVGPIGRVGSSPPSSREIDGRSAPPPRQSVSASPEVLRRTVPFQLTARARSELAEVHQRSRRVTLATDQFVNHTVQLGETLQTISQKYFGRPDYYLDIYLANQDIMANPSSVPIGRTLKIPVFEQ